MSRHDHSREGDSQLARRELELMQRRWPLNPRFYLVALIIVLALIFALA